MVLKRLLITALLGLFYVTSLSAGPVIQAWQTGNGAKVLFVQAPEIPMLNVRVVFDAGSARDGDKPGVTSFTSSLLTQGAGAWNANQIAERMENVGAELGVGSLRDMAWVSVRSLTEPKALNTAMETLATVLSKPLFAEADIERVRKRILASLLQAIILIRHLQMIQMSIMI